MLQDLENSTSKPVGHGRTTSEHRVRVLDEKNFQQEQNSTAGYASVLTKSRSQNSLAETGGNMLKDLDQALKASTNYIESHRTTQLPNGGSQEYHEYRSTTTSGGNSGYQPRNLSEDFNLERQVRSILES